MLFKQYGEETLPAVLFFPAATLPAALFRPVVRAMRDGGYRVIIPQYTQVIPDALHLAQEAEEYLRPITGPVSVCGVGYGASAAVELIGLCPERFDAAILERPVFLPQSPNSFPNKHFAWQQDRAIGRLYRQLAPTEMQEEDFRKAIALPHASPAPTSLPLHLADIPAIIYFPSRSGYEKTALRICQLMKNAFAQPDSRLMSVAVPDTYVAELNHLREVGVTFREPSVRMKKEKSK